MATATQKRTNVNVLKTSVNGFGHATIKALLFIT